jgi:hypothetical protein
MIDEKKLLARVRKKVWDTFQTTHDEIEFLAELRHTELSCLEHFLENEFTREEVLHVQELIRSYSLHDTKH